MDPVAFELSAAGDYNRQRQAKVYREYQAALKRIMHWILTIDHENRRAVPCRCRGA